uniref:Uncharacterized protein n=1 Tax=Amorphochlora amoebiformis TaxID=1561963 RepID=A0A7S0DPJ7_9EUKA|mmetsp:Transcript_479/g.699  ORF Transcript_479/g.699 Transcript_479/m.699 type:complete len:236 (+) Transcript_479:552-1259(+)
MRAKILSDLSDMERKRVRVHADSLMFHNATALVKIPRVNREVDGESEEYETVRLTFNKTRHLACLSVMHESENQDLFSVGMSVDKHDGFDIGNITMESSHRFNAPHSVFNVNDESLAQLYLNVMPCFESPIDLVDLLLALPFPKTECKEIREARQKMLDDVVFRTCCEIADDHRMSSFFGTGASETDMRTESTFPDRTEDTEDHQLHDIIGNWPPRQRNSTKRGLTSRSRTSSAT